MFPLNTRQLPHTPDELEQALRSGFERVLVDSSRASVRAAGQGETIDRLEVDLSHCIAGRTEVPRPVDAPSLGEITCRQISFFGDPLRVQQAGVTFRLEAEQARLQLKQTTRDFAVLVPSEGHGTIDTRVPVAGIESLLASQLDRATRQHGAALTRSRLHLEEIGPRSLRLNLFVEVTRRIVFKDVSGAFEVLGHLTIDDSLEASLSDLACQGQGMLSSAVAPLIQSRLDAVNGQRFPLAAFPLGQIHLHDVQLGITNHNLTVHARFGAAPAA